MVFLINGVDFSDTVAQGGMEWTRNDIDDKNSGRSTLDGKMHRGRIAIKYKCNVTCMDLGDNRCRQLLEAIEPETIMITTNHPRYGVCTREYYSNNVPTTHLRTQEDGTEKWTGIKYPLVEV